MYIPVGGGCTSTLLQGWCLCKTDCRIPTPQQQCCYVISVGVPASHICIKHTWLIVAAVLQHTWACGWCALLLIESEPYIQQVLSSKHMPHVLSLRPGHQMRCCRQAICTVCMLLHRLCSCSWMAVIKHARPFSPCSSTSVTNCRAVVCWCLDVMVL